MRTDDLPNQLNEAQFRDGDVEDFNLFLVDALAYLQSISAEKSRIPNPAPMLGLSVRPSPFEGELLAMNIKSHNDLSVNSQRAFIHSVLITIILFKHPIWGFSI